MLILLVLATSSVFGEEDITCFSCSYIEYENGTISGKANCKAEQLQNFSTQVEKKYHGGSSTIEDFEEIVCKLEYSS